MKKTIISLSDVLDKITLKLTGLSAACLAVITVFIIGEIVARRFFGYGFLFVLEVNTYMLGASWFLASAYTLRTGGHIRVNILTGVVKSEKAVKWLDIFATVVGIVVAVMFFQAIAFLAWESFRLGKTSYTALRAPLYIPKVVMAAGMGVMLLQMIVRLLLLLIDEKPDINFKTKQAN